MPLYCLYPCTACALVLPVPLYSLCSYTDCALVLLVSLYFMYHCTAYNLVSLVPLHCLYPCAARLPLYSTSADAPAALPAPRCGRGGGRGGGNTVKATLLLLVMLGRFHLVPPRGEYATQKPGSGVITAERAGWVHSSLGSALGTGIGQSFG